MRILAALCRAARDVRDSEDGTKMAVTNVPITLWRSAVARGGGGSVGERECERSGGQLLLPRENESYLFNRSIILIMSDKSLFQSCRSIR